MDAFRLACAGCGTPAPPLEVEPFPFRCACAQTRGDTDHVVRKILAGAPPTWPSGGEDNPFVRYRSLLYSYHVASSLSGTSDVALLFSRTRDLAFLDLVARLDDAIFDVSGQRFQVTPFTRNEKLGAWIKDETGNVSGSHKARHLAGIMLYLQALERLHGISNRPELAIASCGNAALAATVVARAAGWTLRTFVPPDADPAVVDRLHALGATLVVCPRRPGEAGDPCYARFKAALAEGALPFCCQGPDNGLTIEGGETLAYEMIDQLGSTELDAIVVQVGGGALASACIQGFARAAALGRITRVPRVYTVQTEGAAPLARAFDRVAERAGRTGPDEALRYAATHRSEFMWPWETAPHSVAHGILDDETYDWLAVVDGMLRTGGRPIVVSEPELVEANRHAREVTGINVDHTGSAGLAGLMGLRTRREIDGNEQAAVIFSGVRRSADR